MPDRELYLEIFMYIFLGAWFGLFVKGLFGRLTTVLVAGLTMYYVSKKNGLKYGFIAGFIVGMIVGTVVNATAFW